MINYRYSLKDIYNHPEAAMIVYIEEDKIGGDMVIREIYEREIKLENLNYWRNKYGKSNARFWL